MSEFTKQIYHCFSVIVLFFLFFNHSFGQLPKPDFLDRKINWEMTNPTFQQVCSLLSSKEIMIGLEMSADLDSSKTSKTLHIESGTVREILDSLVKQEPNYKWEVRDGVINIYPTHQKDEILNSLLNIKFQSIMSKKEAGKKQIADQIYKSNAVKMLLNSRRIELDIAYFMDMQLANDVNISDTDLRGVLNQVVKDSIDAKNWSIERKANGRIFLFF